MTGLKPARQNNLISMVINPFKSYWWIVMLSGVILVSCRPVPSKSPHTQKPDAVNLATVYNPSAAEIKPEFRVWHKNDSLSTAYIGIQPSEFLFNQANAKGIFLTSFRLHYELLEMADGLTPGQVADSGSYTYILQKDRLHGVFYTTFNFRCYFGKTYSLRLYTYDMMRKKSTISLIPVDKTNRNNQQYFMAFTPISHLPIFKTWINDNRNILLEYGPEGYDSVYVSWYKKKQPLPLPIFTSEVPADMLLRPDSVWKMALKDTMRFQNGMAGVFHFGIDTANRKGYTLICPGEDFPVITTPLAMISPLAYLTSSTEQKAIEQNPNPKQAMDDFWLGCGKVPQVAREMIRIYYTRVQYANFYFTTDREGWKTDRGMIYVIYGPPKILIKKDGQETWTYFLQSGESIRFTFRYKENPFTNNLYELQRNLEPSPHWREAVDSWRNGRVFLTL